MARRETNETGIGSGKSPREAKRRAKADMRKNARKARSGKPVHGTPDVRPPERSKTGRWHTTATAKYRKK
jgi:hypothetical protein